MIAILACLFILFVILFDIVLITAVGKLERERQRKGDDLYGHRLEEEVDE